MDSENIAALLLQKNVTPTANRILVFRTLKALGRPGSLGEITDFIGTMDKSSVYRSLSLFLENDVVHSIDDGSGVLKYEICGSERHSAADMHAHFYCESCGRLFCLELPIPMSAIALPEHFTAHSVNFVIKGECRECRMNHGCD